MPKDMFIVERLNRSIVRLFLGQLHGPLRSFIQAVERNDLETRFLDHPCAKVSHTQVSES